MNKQVFIKDAIYEEVLSQYSCFNHTPLREICVSIFDAALHNYAVTADTNFDTLPKTSQKEIYITLTKTKGLSR